MEIFLLSYLLTELFFIIYSTLIKKCMQLSRTVILSYYLQNSF